MAITGGGGLNVTQGILTLLGGDFISNTAGQEGGGLFLDSSTQVSVTNTTLIGNAAKLYGGGLNSELSTTRLTNVTFSNNAAQAGGGAGFDNSQATWDHITFSNNSAGVAGGGLDIADSVVNLTNALLTGNQSPQGGGANVSAAMVNLSGGTPGNHPATLLGSTFTLTDASLIHNTSLSGGGVHNGSLSRTSLMNVNLSANAAKYGGAVVNSLHGSLDISNTSLSGNSAEFGGAISNLSSGVVTMTASTINGNTASQSGGGIDAGSGRVTLVNATVSGNTAGTGGGVSDEAATVTLTNTTVSNNSASTAGGGLANEGGAFILASSLLAGNAAGGNCFQAAGTITSHGYNLSDDSLCAAFFMDSGDQNNVALHLGPLANHGGPTETQLPGAGSPAIDAIPQNANGCGLFITSDQRGFARPFNGRCDIGAVETGYVAPLLWLPLTWR